MKNGQGKNLTELIKNGKRRILTGMCQRDFPEFSTEETGRVS